MGMNALLKQAKQTKGQLSYVLDLSKSTANIHISTLNHQTTCSRVWDTEKFFVLTVGGHYS